MSTEERIESVQPQAAKHRPGLGASSGWCAYCAERWPCSAAALTAARAEEAARWRAKIEALARTLEQRMIARDYILAKLRAMLDAPDPKEQTDE